MSNYQLTEGAVRKTAETTRQVLGNRGHVGVGGRPIVGATHVELEGILQGALAAASNVISGKTTAQMKLLRVASGADGLVLSDQEITVTNRSTRFSAQSGDYLRVTYINREFRPMAAAGCEPSNAIWGLVLIGLPLAGTFTLTFRPSLLVAPQTTSPIAYNASAATVQAALEALSHIGAGNVNVSGAGGGFNYHIEFTDDMGEQSITGLTSSGAGLLGHGVGAASYLIQQGRA